MSDLRTFLDKIRKNNDLKTVKRPVTTKHEIAAVTAKVNNSYAVMFENIKESKFRLVSNLVGTRARFATAVDTKQENIHKQIVSAIKNAKTPKVSTSAKFMENSSRSSSILPIVTHFEKEPGPFITSSVIHVVNPDTGEQNSSFHRMMPIDDRHFSVRMVEGRHLHRCFVDAKEHGEDLKVAITIGVHPAVLIAGAYQAEWGENELRIANALLGGKLSLFKCPITGLQVPSNTEIVMEGHILHDKTHKEWMVEMLQTYDHRRYQPVFELEALYFRNDPIFHDILSGYSEHRFLMGMPIEAKLDGKLKGLFKNTGSVSLTNGGCKWLHAVVQINKRKESEPKQIIKQAFQIHRSLKQVIVVDDDINPDDAEQVEYALATRFQADKDLVTLKNVRGSSLDPSSDQKQLKTAKTGLDATKPFKKSKEGFEIAKIPGIEKISLTKYFK